jgi:dihydrofolate reductase
MAVITVSEFLTLDGVFEAPGGEHHPDGKGGWTFSAFSPELGAYKQAEVEGADRLLLGRVTYEHFASAWPEMTDDTGFADRMNEMPKHVVSTTLREPLAWNATLVDDPASPAGDLLVLGSGELVDALLRRGIVDELRLQVFPVLLGSGRKLFRDGIGTGDLELADEQQFPNGVVALEYRPRR